jgi:hypothetical protein
MFVIFMGNKTARSPKRSSPTSYLNYIHYERAQLLHRIALQEDHLRQVERTLSKRPKSPTITQYILVKQLLAEAKMCYDVIIGYTKQINKLDARYGVQ